MLIKYNFKKQCQIILAYIALNNFIRIYKAIDYIYNEEMAIKRARLAYNQDKQDKEDFAPLVVDASTQAISKFKDKIAQDI